MKFNWAEHGNRTSRLTLLERGLFDAIRTELWTVVNAKMHREDLKLRLRITSETEEDMSLNRLIALGLLREDSSGFISDEIQTFEFGRAVEKAEKTRESAKSRWAKAERLPERKEEDQDLADF